MGTQTLLVLWDEAAFLLRKWNLKRPLTTPHLSRKAAREKDWEMRLAEFTSRGGAAATNDNAHT